ncbi:MAG: hypothetical protein IPF66_18105 [Holophagales bacterium]|nr:hypothetical protein [Holophagales bacterium]
MRACGRRGGRSSSIRFSRSRRGEPMRRRSSHSPRRPCLTTWPGHASISRSLARMALPPPRKDGRPSRPAPAHRRRDSRPGAGERGHAARRHPADAPPAPPPAPGAGAAWRSLRHLGRTLGVAAFEGSRPRAFRTTDVDLAEALAEAISLGLGKAGLAQAREELTRMMVHDLRGPISGVMGALELLGEAPGLDDGNRRLLDAAERNTRRQLKLVEGILELARLEEGPFPFGAKTCRSRASSTKCCRWRCRPRRRADWS